MKVFVGPIINYVDRAGIGIVTGCSYNISEIFKVVLRHEITGQSNNLSLGFNLLYRQPDF